MGQAVVHRSFHGGRNKNEDPRLNHLDGCEPLLYPRDVQKLLPSENHIETTTSESRFPPLRVQKYTYSVVHRLKDNESKCYRFYVRQKNVFLIRLQCARCHRLSKKKGCISYYCAPSGFTCDPSHGNFPECQSLSYNDVMKENEIIGKEEAEKAIFEKKPVVESLRNITSDDPSASEESSNCNLENIHVIEVRQKVSYIYRLPNDGEKYYRFIFKKLSKNRILLECSSCKSITSQKKLEGPKTCSAKTWTTDGNTMQEDPTRNHYPEGILEPFSRVLKTHRILEDENPAQKGRDRGFLLIHSMKIGQRNLMYTLPNDETKCYHFQFETLSHKPYCATCYGIIRMSKISMRPYMYKISGAGFHDDPLLYHLPECKPSLKKLY